MKLRQTVAEFPRPYIRSRGAWLAVRAMIIGSAAFAIIESLSIQVNSYFVQHIEPMWNLVGIVCCIGWPVFILGIGIVFATIPAIILGMLLETLVVKCRLMRWVGTIVGVAMGTIGGVLICAPILWTQYDFVSQTGHGSIEVFELRAALAVVMAAMCGGWTGARLVNEGGKSESV